MSFGDNKKLGSCDQHVRLRLKTGCDIVTLIIIAGRGYRKALFNETFEKLPLASQL
jgi:hypothetical protein